MIISGHKITVNLCHRGFTSSGEDNNDDKTDEEEETKEDDCSSHCHADGNDRRHELPGECFLKLRFCCASMSAQSTVLCFV